MTGYQALDSGGYLHNTSCFVVEYFPEKSHWCSIEEVSQGVKCQTVGLFQEVNALSHYVSLPSRFDIIIIVGGNTCICSNFYINYLALHFAVNLLSFKF